MTRDPNEPSATGNSSAGISATSGTVLVYGTAVLTGAALVFQIQPIAGKLLLPSFGGSASVWTTCMFFFQAMLLAGYAYAHVLTTVFRPRHQVFVHGLLLLLSAVFLPVSVAAAGADAATGPPAARILLTLLLAIGFPFVMLASTAPLMQRWSAMTRPGRSPYRLYALSNAGALLALLTYPLLVEPNLSLEAQRFVWSTSYALFLLVSLAACALVRARYRPTGRSGNSGPTAEQDVPGRYPYSDAGVTVLLSASGVVLLLAVTNQITQNVAPVPFLWILPLVAYLLTYIIAFSGQRWYDRSIWGSLFIVAASSSIVLHFFGTFFPIVPVISAWLLVLFCGCMVCHGELYRLRPPAGRLTVYYLLIASGGAIGGALVSIVAPAVFVRYWEELAAFYAVYLIFGLLVLRDFNAKRRLQVAADSLQATLERWSGRLFAAAWSTGVFLLPAVVIVIDVLRVEYDVASSRNFYGILQIRDEISEGVPRRILVDGTTLHGFQLLQDSARTLPTSYYAANTGVARVMEVMDRSRGLHVGVVGLGTGTMAAFGEAEDQFRFYELNPAVIDVANSHFSFLRDSKAAVEIVPGDARVSLELELRQSGSRNYDVLIIDAFNSDAIPVHLLTVEAMRLYWSHLKPRGVLAVHVTNNYLDLAPVVADLAAEVGKEALFVSTTADGAVRLTADWLILTGAPDVVAGIGSDDVIAARLGPRPSARLWTDDFSNLAGALRR